MGRSGWCAGVLALALASRAAQAQGTVASPDTEPDSPPVTAPATRPTPADPPPAPPPAPQRKPDSLLMNVAGGLALGVGLAVLVGAVAASGDEQDRNGTAALDATLAVLAPLGGPGAFSLMAGFGSLGAYNLLNHNSPAARRWVNGGGMLLTFAAAAVEVGLSRRPDARDREEKTSWWLTPTEAGFAARF
jgi:hypothetical protein